MKESIVNRYKELKKVLAETFTMLPEETPKDDKKKDEKDDLKATDVDDKATEEAKAAKAKAEADDKAAAEEANKAAINKVGRKYAGGIYSGFGKFNGALDDIRGY
jgi:membrane protein involved in colicin uptake